MKPTDPDILYLNIAGQDVVILNSIDAAEELLERRSASFSSRPRFTMVCELMGWDFSFIFFKYGPTWRNHRKFMHQSFNSNAVNKFRPHITKSVHGLVRNLLSEPEGYERHVKHLASELILLISYGIQVKSEADPFVKLPLEPLAGIAEAIVPGRFLVDALPWLKHVPSWMPFAGFQRKASQWKKATTDMVEIPFHAAKQDVLAGKAINSLVADGVRNMGDSDNPAEYEDIVKHVAGTMFFAASESTTVVVLNGIFALMCNPEIQEKAQAEIDMVVKPGHLPDFNDKESLPYLSAVVKEVLRWYTVSPLGAPHFVDSDEVYKGYLIPANTFVFANLWGITHNEATYPDPHTFKPERFLKDGKIDPTVHDPQEVVFGYGRRRCSGEHFALLTAWMAMACLITLFDISKPVDENGNVIEPKMEWTSNGFPTPLPFKCNIKPRSRAAAEAIERTKNYEYFNE
ncbi:hypothetical protein AX16_001479 [Volvariella volvacea WC 439]|nr:hypothetical protein AX16_001479 [Volvariella volvacea WC 439]